MKIILIIFNAINAISCVFKTFIEYRKHKISIFLKKILPISTSLMKIIYKNYKMVARDFSRMRMRMKAYAYVSRNFCK
jgi:hypothetical protein